MRMCRMKGFVLAVTAAICAAACSPQKKQAEEWQYLFDGTDLVGWETYLGAEFKPGLSWDSVRKLPPIGLNNDTASVFSIVELDGERVLRISGQYFGGISTKDEFENFHLQLEFKWGEKKWFPREGDTDKRDSGVLYYAVGEHGDGDGFWLRAQELQIQEGDCGDYWGVAGALADITSTLNADSVYQFDMGGELRTFSRHSESGRYCKKNPDGENAHGEWNVVDLYAYNGTSLHLINGKLNMMLKNSRIENDGIETPLTKGRLELQSEAAEVFYRNIRIQPLTELPKIK